MLRTDAQTMMLKPDALHGASAIVTNDRCSDYLRHLSAALKGSVELPGHVPCTPLAAETSAAAWARVRWALDRQPWLRLEEIEVEPATSRLDALADGLDLAGSSAVKTLVFDTVRALGFEIRTMQPRRMTLEDCQRLYPSICSARFFSKMSDYMVDREVLFLMVVGQQSPAALHVMKTYLRKFLKYPGEQEIEMRNYLHVPDLGADESAFMFEVLDSGVGALGRA